MALQLELNMEAKTLNDSDLLRFFNKARLLLTLFLLSISAHKTHAQINWIEGSFRTQEHHRLGQFELLQAYSSRSLQRGLFGWGWCSNLEDALEFKNGRVEIRVCPHRARFRFKKQTPRNAVDRFLSGLESSSPENPLPLFESVTGSDGFIQKTQSQWVWHRPDGSWHSFDSNGRPVKKSFIEGGWVEWKYDSKGKLLGVQTQDGKFIRIGLTGNLVTQVKHPGKTLNFQYESQKLVRVDQSGSKPSRYVYDEHDNLVLLKKNGRQQTKIAYDSQDRILLLEDFVQQCREGFSYSSSSSDHLEVHHRKECAGQNEEKTYSFLFSRRQDGQRILASAEIHTEKDLRRIEFDPTSGLPVQSLIIPSAFKSHELVFDSSGRLIRIKEPDKNPIRLHYSDVKAKHPHRIELSRRQWLDLIWPGGYPVVEKVHPPSEVHAVQQRLKSVLELLSEIKTQETPL